MLFPPLPADSVWPVVTRLGEVQILLPATLALCLWLAWRPRARPLVGWWLALLAVATFVTTLSKIAFLGWGIGNATLDFTGVSGHAMFAAAIYPLLLGAVFAQQPVGWQRVAVGIGAALALLVAVSRVKVGAHSVSEVLAGMAVGGLVSAWALSRGHLPRVRVPMLLPLALAAWLAVTPAHAPPSQTHGWVTNLSLSLSGRDRAYTRLDLRRTLQPTQQRTQQRTQRHEVRHALRRVLNLREQAKTDGVLPRFSAHRSRRVVDTLHITPQQSRKTRMNTSRTQSRPIALHRAVAHSGAIEWEELPSLAGSLAERRRAAEHASNSSFDRPEFGAAWSATMPAALAPLREPEPFRETLNGIAMREVHEPEVFRHFFG